MGRKAATDFLESLDATPPAPEPEPPAPVAPAVAPAGTGRARAEAYLASIPDADLRAPSQRTEALDPAKTDALRLELLNAVRDEKRSELRRKPGMAEADIDREVERAVREVDAVTRVTGPGAEDGSDIIATLGANLEPASLSSTMTRVFGQRLIPVGPEAPTKADRDKAQRALEQSFRGGASTVRDDFSRAWEKGLTPTEEIKDPETAQRVSWMDKLEESAAFGAKAALTGGLWPLYESVTGSGPGFDVHPIDAVREAVKDPVVQRMSPVSTEGPTRAAKAAVGLYARTPAPDVMQAVIDGATKLGLDVEVEPGKFAEVADSLRPYEAFDAANDSYLTGDRSKVEALPWYELPAILRGEVPNVAVFKTRAQEGDPDLAALVPFLDRDDSFIAKQIERLPVGVIRKVQPDMAPTDAELDNVFKVRDGVKEWRAEDMARDAAALFNAGLMDSVGQDGRLYVAPSKLQKAMQVANLAWTGLMNVDVNPLSPLAPIGVPGVGEAAERFLPEGTFQNTLTDIRVPTKTGLDSMIRSGTYDGILAWAGLGGSADYADLYAPGSTWLSRSLAETADPNYAGRWIADTYERAGGVPNSPTMRAMVTADLAAQFLLPAEELALVPLARGLAAANRGRRALAVARELGQDTRAARRTALASMLNLNTGLTPAEGARLNELVPLVRAKTATPEQAVEAAALTRKGAPKDAVEALHGQLLTQAMEGIRNGTLRPEQIGPRTREQLGAMFRRAGVQDADGMVTRLMNDLADRRAAVLDTMTELAEVGGPATDRLRKSAPYAQAKADLNDLVSMPASEVKAAQENAAKVADELRAKYGPDSAKWPTPETATGDAQVDDAMRWQQAQTRLTNARRGGNLTPQERDVMLRILEASAFRAVQDGAVATPEEYFARQMWRRASPEEEAAEAAGREELGAGTLYSNGPPQRPTLPEPADGSASERWRFARKTFRGGTPEDFAALRAWDDAHPEWRAWSEYRQAVADYELRQQQAAAAAARDAEKQNAAARTASAKDGKVKLTKPERAANFDQWFGESVITDTGGTDGKPLLVSHETSAKFNEFRAGEFGFHFGVGIPEGMFGNRTIKGHLRMENPYRMRDLGVWTPEAVLKEGPFGKVEADELMAEVERIRAANDAPTEKMVSDARARGNVAQADKWQALIDDDSEGAMFRDRRGNYLASQPVHQALRDLGYDGIVYANEAEGPGDSFIALDPTQFKSARNIGTYDPKDPNFLRSRDAAGTRGAITPTATTRTVPNPDYPAWVAEGTQAQADVERLEGMGTPGAETPEWRAWKAARDERASLQTQRDTLRRNPRAEDPEWHADLEDVEERLAVLPDPGPEPTRFDYDLRYIPDEMRRLTPEWVSWREGDSERVALLERWTAELEALQGEPRELDPAWREEVRSLQEHIGAFSEGEPEPTKFVDVPDGWTAKYDADVDAYIVRDESGKTIGSATSYDDGVITPEQALTLVASRRAAEAPRGIDLRVVGEVAATDPTGVSLRNPRNIYAAQLAHARARLAGLRARKVPRNMDAPGLTRWLIRLFKTGDVRTAMHEGTHLLDLVLGEEWTRKAAKALGYTDEQVTAAFGGDNRLLVEIRERIAEAGTRELRGTLRPGSKIANAMEDVSDFIGDVWRRVRNVPGVTTPEFKRVWDATFRPQDTLRDLAVRLVDEREPGPITRTVFTTGTPEEEIRVGPQRRRGQAEQATNVLRADNEVRAMLGIREGQAEVRADELLANALATIGTEQARRSWGFGELEMLTPLTAVSPQRKKDIQREVAAYRAAWLGGEAPRPSVVGGEEVFTLTPDQARGMRAMVNDLLDSPVSATLPERLKDPAADVSTLTAEEWNAIVNRQLEMKAGAGAWRDRAAERAAVSGATRLVNLVGDYTRDPRRPRAVAETATMLRDWFVVQAKVADYVNPAAREVLEGMAREIGDSGKAVAERVINIQRQGKGWREALPLVAASVQPESVPVEQLSTLRAVDRIPEATDIEQVMASGDDLRTLFNSSPIADPRQTAYEQAGLALLGGIHARMVKGFDYTAALSDMGVTTDAANDAMAYVQEGVRRRRELVDQVGKDILLTFAGADDVQALAGQGPLLTERARRAYASWYTGDWVDGLLLNTETGKAASSPLFDQGGAALRVLVRLEARRRLAGMTRRLAEVGATGNLSEVLAAGTRYDRPYEFGTLANEVGAITGPKHLADVAHYIDAETSWSLYDTVRMDAPEDVPSLALAPGRLPPSGAPNPMAHDEALRILQRLGFKRGKGTGWKPIDLPDGSRIIAPPLFMEPIEEVVKNTAPTAGAFGSGEKLGTMVAGTGNARSFADNAAQLAVDALHNGYTYAVGKFKAGLTTGLGPLMRPAFFMGNFLGGMAQAYTRVGAIGAAKALTKPLLLNEEGAVVRRVMKRMWADGQGFPGWAPERPMDHGFFDTFGRWHSDRSIADGLVRAGLNSSLPQAELSRSLIEDIKANEPGIWNRLMNNPKLAAGVGAAVGGVLGGPGGAVAGAPVVAMLTRWWQDTMTHATTGVDNYWRVSLYVDALKRGVPEEEAARVARDATFDYNQMTNFERRVMRRAVLFYSFQRRNQDLFWWAVLNEPGRLMAQLRLLGGLQRANLEEDPELFLPEWAEGRPVVGWREPLAEGHAANNSTGAVMLLPRLPIGDALGLWQGLWGALNMEPSGLSATVGKANPLIQAGFILTTGTDVHRMRSIESYNVIPNWFVEMDDALTGGMLVRDTFRATPGQAKNPASEGYGNAPVWVVGGSATDKTPFKWWWVFRQLTAAGSAMDTITQMQRADLGETLVGEHGYVHAAVDAATRGTDGLPEDTETARVGLTEGQELGKWLGVMPLLVPSRPEVAGSAEMDVRSDINERIRGLRKTEDRAYR